MKDLLKWGMSAEELKQVLQKQGGNDIKEGGGWAGDVINAVIGSYLYSFRFKSHDGKLIGLMTMAISEYLDDY